MNDSKAGRYGVHGWFFSNTSQKCTTPFDLHLWSTLKCLRGYFSGACLSVEQTRSFRSSFQKRLWKKETRFFHFRKGGPPCEHVEPLARRCLRCWSQGPVPLRSLPSLTARLAYDCVLKKKSNQNMTNGRIIYWCIDSICGIESSGTWFEICKLFTEVPQNLSTIRWISVIQGFEKIHKSTACEYSGEHLNNLANIAQLFFGISTVFFRALREVLTR